MGEHETIASRLKVGNLLSNGRYLLKDKLGAGRDAMVWRARDATSATDVVVKVLLPELAADPIHRERFLRGARAMSKIAHASIARVLDISFDAIGLHYYTMEFVRGNDLRNAVLSGQIGPDQALPIILALGGALAKVHAAGFVHRAVRPANILLGEAGVPKLIHFDFVGGLGAAQGAARPTDPSIFTAPELIHRPDDVDVRADVYGLGMTTLFVLHGEELLDSMQLEQMSGVIGGLRNGDAVKDVIARAIDISAEKRFEGVSAYCDALDLALDLDPEQHSSIHLNEYISYDGDYSYDEPLAHRSASSWPPPGMARSPGRILRVSAPPLLSYEPPKSRAPSVRPPSIGAAHGWLESFPREMEESASAEDESLSAEIEYERRASVDERMSSRSPPRERASPLPPATGTLFPKVSSTPDDFVEPDQEVVFALEVDRIAPKGVTAALRVAFPEGAASTLLHASVSSTSFAPPAGESWSRTFSIGRDLVARPGRWEFRARALGEQVGYSLTITFVSAGLVIGAIVVVIPGRRTLGLAPGLITMGEAIALPKEQGLARLVMKISSEPPGYKIRLYLDGEQVGDAIPWSISTDPYFSQLEEASSLDDLHAVGAGLWADLPASVTALLEQPDLEGAPVLIVSDTAIAPFEVLRLRPSDARGPLLGLDRPVLRWIHDAAMSLEQERVVGGVACIRPDYQEPDTLPSAAQEEEELRARVPSLRRVARLDEFDELLNDAGVRLVHFAGHADGNPAKLALENGSVVPARFVPSKPLLCEGNPFMFLNGCRVGRARDATPSSQANIIKMLLRFKCIGVVAPAIPVQSAAALCAARTFYAALFEGKSVGDAMLDVRRLTSARTTEPGHLASLMSYVAFAPPGFRMRFGATDREASSSRARASGLSVDTMLREAPLLEIRDAILTRIHSPETDSTRVKQVTTLLKNPTSIGREVSADSGDIVLSHVNISRQHARIELRGFSLVVIDTGSTNGTFVSAQPAWTEADMVFGAALLRHGDYISFGREYTFQIVLEHYVGGEPYMREFERLKVDPLTGLPSRRYLDWCLEREALRAQQRRLSLSFLVLRVMKQPGHAARSIDGQLIELAQIVRRQSPDGLVGHFGTRSLGVLLDGKTVEQAVKLGAAVAREAPLSMSVHFGAAELQADDQDPAEALRNRVIAGLGMSSEEGSEDF